MGLIKMAKPTPADMTKFLTEVRKEIKDFSDHASATVDEYNLRGTEYDGFIQGLAKALEIINKKADFWLRGL